MNEIEINEKETRTKNMALILGGIGLVILAVVSVLLTLPNGDQPASAEEVTFPPIEVNQPAPSLTLTSLSGEEVSLTDFQGKVILVNNWATWCPPCRLEMPEFNSYFNTYQEEGFDVVAVEAGQPENEVKEFVEELQLDFTVLLDPEKMALEMFQNSSLPSSYIIDRNGNLRLVWLGAINEATLEEFVTPIIKE